MSAELALSDVDNARLPATYEAAKSALAECMRIDECKQWANKAEALASYARQSKDDELELTARRIAARALNRCGELLKEIEPAPGHRSDIKPRDGGDPRLTREKAASDAGLSERQRKTALRIANVPKDQFDSLVESKNPPTVSDLAELGKLPAPLAPKRNPVSHEALWLWGRLRDFDSDYLDKEPAAILETMTSQMLDDVHSLAPRVASWLRKIGATK